MKHRSIWFGSGLALVLFSTQPSSAKTPDEGDRKLYEEAVAALKKGAPTEAIQEFELLSDRGVLHPDISYDRAVAYATRARSPQAKPGDLGRAAFAISEALTLAPEDAAARTLLERIDHELSRSRSQRGSPSLLARARLSRAIVGLLGEDTWAMASLFFSAATTLGLALALGARAHRARLTGSIVLVLGLVLGLGSVTGLALARSERLETRSGVVVAPEARLLDATGAALTRTRVSTQDRVIPEGARVRVKGRTDRLLLVEWGDLDAYVSPTDVQLLPAAAP
ncbi:MAG: hypothetical protein QM784_25130 [Polyangiaceae bacterium]